MRVNELFGIINEFAPFEGAESYDNVGILCGSADHEITGILVCLDVTFKVIEKAKENNCNTIVSHHPILFRGRKNVREDDPEGKLICSLIRNNLNLIAVHTNFDNAEFGVSYHIAEYMGLTDIDTILPGVKIGNLPKAMDGSEFREYLENKFHTAVRAYGERTSIRRVALCGGAGGEFFREAIAAGADAYVTGEMRYHDSMEASDYSMATYAIGHDSSEIIAIGPLAEMIKGKTKNTNIVVF